MFLLVVACAVIGCDSATATVSGKVSYNGTTLKGGNVQFITADGHAFHADINEDGGYTILKATPGTVKITVETQSLAPPPSGVAPPPYKPPPGAGTGSYTPPDPAANAKRYVQIPDIYSDAKTTTLTYTVKPGSQQYDIPLK
jgi:hypothetical protein